MIDHMTAKVEFLAQDAAALMAQGQHRPVPELADQLNARGLETSYGTPFVGTRGTYTLLQAAYRRLVNEGRDADADNIAEAYVRPDGTHAWDK